MPRVLITGGAGFVGANLAVGLASRHPDWNLVAFDNLHRRGSELNLPRLEDAGVEFVKGDVREPGDLLAVVDSRGDANLPRADWHRGADPARNRRCRRGCHPVAGSGRAAVRPNTGGGPAAARRRSCAISSPGL